MTLDEILDSVNAEQAEIPAVKRSIRKARHGFKSNSSKSVDRLTLLASYLYMGGDSDSSIALFEFIDQETQTGLDSRRDLEGSLAVARLLLAYVFSKLGMELSAQEILLREDNKASRNIENYDELLYENVLQDEIGHGNSEFQFLENHDDLNSPKAMLWASYVSFMKLVVLHERLPEIEEKVSAADKRDLVDSLLFYEDKFRHYLYLA